MKSPVGLLGVHELTLQLQFHDHSLEIWLYNVARFMAIAEMINNLWENEIHLSVALSAFLLGPPDC